MLYNCRFHLHCTAWSCVCRFDVWQDLSRDAWGFGQSTTQTSCMFGVWICIVATAGLDMFVCLFEQICDLRCQVIRFQSFRFHVVHCSEGFVMCVQCFHVVRFQMLMRDILLVHSCSKCSQFECQASLGFSLSCIFKLIFLIALTKGLLQFRLQSPVHTGLCLSFRFWCRLLTAMNTCIFSFRFRLLLRVAALHFRQLIAHIIAQLPAALVRWFKARKPAMV